MRTLILTLAFGLTTLGPALSPPPPTAPHQPHPVVTTPEQTSEWIDFELYRDTRIFIPITINGYETLGVLDSGAAFTTIDASLASEAGIVGSGNFRASGTGGTVSVQMADDVTISVGNVSLDGLRVAIADLSDVADRLLGRPLPVIIGAEWFDARIVDIDFPNRRLAFHDRDEWTYEGPGESVPLIPNGAGRLVEIRVEDGEPIRAGFDIGQGSPVTILKPHADAIDLLEGRETGTVLAGGVGGSTTEHVTTIGSLEFGGFRFESVPAIVPGEAVGAFNTTRMQANLGTGIYGRFRMIVDFSSNILILEPSDETTARPFARNRAGLQFERTSRGLEISHVSEGSPAASAGMQVGEIVTMIDGRRVGPDYWSGDLWRWTSGQPGETVGVILESGRAFTLTLRDYF